MDRWIEVWRSYRECGGVYLGKVRKSFCFPNRWELGDVGGGGQQVTILDAVHLLVLFARFPKVFIRNVNDRDNRSRQPVIANSDA